MLAWELDTGLDPDFPLYTRGNIGEVFPDVVTPLTQTVFLRTYEAAWRRAWTSDFSVMAPISPEKEFLILAVAGARAYLNLSLIRMAADRAPDTDPLAIDSQFFSVGVELEPYVRPQGADEMSWHRSAEEAVNRHFRDFPDFDADRALAVAFRSTRAADEADAQLIARLDRAAELSLVTFARHVISSTMASAAWARVCNLLVASAGEEKGGDLTRRALGGLGSVESAGPASMLRDLAASHKGRATLDDVEGFLRIYGFRGINEFELASPSWEQRPEVVLDLIDAAREAPDGTDAVAERAAALEEARAAVVDQERLDEALRAGAFYVAGREKTKATQIIVVNEARHAAVELGRRAFERGHLNDPEEIFFAARGELEGLLRGDRPDRLGERAATAQKLASLMAPLVLFGEVPPLDTWTPLTTLPSPPPAPSYQGIPGSPGRARGRARVVLDPYGDRPPQPGEVLVAPLTDPGWTPLFLPAVAVVVEVGGELSHAVIVARELGIPCVTGVIGACRNISDGVELEVDGTAGAVRVLG
jgi:rifampicin phosphotransferase